MSGASKEVTALLESLASSNDAVRKEAEAAFENACRTQPAQLCRTLMEAVRYAEDPENRNASSVYLRRVLRDVSEKSNKSGWSLEEDQETASFLRTSALQCFAAEQSPKALHGTKELLVSLAYATFRGTARWPDFTEGLLMIINSGDEAHQSAALSLLSALGMYCPEYIPIDALTMANLIIAKADKANPFSVRVGAIELFAELQSSAAIDKEDEDDEDEEEGNSPNHEEYPSFTFDAAGEGKMQEMIQSSIQVFTDLAGAYVAESVDDAIVPKTADQLVKVLSKFVDMAATDPDTVRKHQNSLLQVMLLLAREAKLGADIRVTAAEFLLVYTEQRPRTVAAVPGLVSAVVRCLMEFLLDHEGEDEADWLSRELSSEDDEDSKLFEAGETGIDRFAAAIEGNTVMPVVFEAAGVFLQEAETAPTERSWAIKSAALVGINQTIEFLPEERVDEQLEKVVDMVCAHLGDAHYKVRYFACKTLGQIALDHRPVCQEKCHAKCLPLIIERMDDPVARVQAQAFAAFVNFAEAVDMEDLEPYVEKVLEKVLHRMSPGFVVPPPQLPEPLTEKEMAQMLRSIREQVVTTIAVIAGVMEDRFAAYLPRVMPLMMTIVDQSVGNDVDRHMQGRALECLSIIVLAMGHNNLPQESYSIADRLVRLYAMQHGEDSTDGGSLKVYVYESLRRMVLAMKGEFAPLVPSVLPILMTHLQFQVAKVDPSQMADYACLYSEDGDGDVCLSGVKTSSIEAMDQALALLGVMVSKGCAAAMAAHAEGLARAVEPLFTMQYSERVSRSAISFYAGLLEAVRKHHPAGATVARVLLKGPLAVILAHCADSIGAEEISEISWSIQGLARCIEGAGEDTLNDDELTDLVNAIYTFLSDATKRMVKISKKKEKLVKQGAAATAATQDGVPVTAEEEIEELTDQLEAEQVFREACLRVQELLMKTHPRAALTRIVPQAVALARQCFAPNSTCGDNDRVVGAIICGDIIERLGEQGYAVIRMELLPALVESVHHTSPWVRQASSFALSLLYYLPANVVDPQLVLSGCERLVQVATHEAAKAKENREATDNAIGALAAAVMHQRAHLADAVLEQIVDLVLDYLPMKYDEVEAEKVHQNIAEALLDEKCGFWGLKREKVGKVLMLLAQLYRRNQTSSTEEAAEKLDKQILGIVATMGLETVAQYVNAGELSHDQVRGFRKLQRDVARLQAAAATSPTATSPA